MMRQRRDVILTDDRCKSELAPIDINAVLRSLDAFDAASPRQPLSAIVQRYLDMR